MFALDTFCCDAPMTRTAIGLGEDAYVLSPGMQIEANYAVAWPFSYTRLSTSTVRLRTSLSGRCWKSFGRRHRFARFDTEAINTSR